MAPLERAPMYQADAYPSRYWMAAKNATQFNVDMKELTTSGNALVQFMLSSLTKQLPSANIGVLFFSPFLCELLLNVSDP